MAVIDPEGLFNGDRLRRCSNTAQLHWPRFFLASDGFGRLEINYARIIGRAYPTFNPVPSETEVHAWLQEYVKNYLLFLYVVDGQLWGQWDTRPELLPKYKTAPDRRSPLPPELEFTEWKQNYRKEKKGFPKCFENVPETFLHGVGVGVGKNICASPAGDALGSDASANPPGTVEDNPPSQSKSVPSGTAQDLTDHQEKWFDEWWLLYPRHTAKKAAREAFGKHVRTQQRFQEVMAATRAQSAEMLAKEEQFRPSGAAWLNGERWQDEIAEKQQPKNDDYPEFRL